MTICAAVLTENLESYKHIRFAEPAAIIMADSRIRFRDGRPPDDAGVKVFQLSEYAICGFAGSVAVANKALAELARIIDSDSIKPQEIVNKAKSLLLRVWDAARRDGMERTDTQVILAVRDDSTKIRLYSLSSNDKFKPSRIRNTPVMTIGSGKSEFDNALQEGFDSLITSWQRRALGRRAFQEDSSEYVTELGSLSEESGDQFVVPWIDVSLSVAMTLREALDITEDESIGGKVQTLALTPRGVGRLGLFVSENDGETWERASL